MNTDIQNNQRIFGLDVVRATAIAMVVFSHVYYLIDSSNPLLISVSGLFGFFGVELFFVLSGFLIASRYMDNKVSFKKYLWNRFVRIYPIYFILTLLTFVLKGFNTEFSYRLWKLGRMVCLWGALGPP